MGSQQSSAQLQPQPIESMSATDRSALQEIIFGAGCFWSVELVYQREPGVMNTAVGYSGGHTVNPTYEQVCSGSTGHTEVVQVKYDPAQVSTEKLLHVFFDKHDATQLNRQGNDRGTQYRSAIYYTNEEQKPIIDRVIAEQQQKNTGKIVTEVKRAGPFYVAEEYHQRYLEKGGQCSLKGDKSKIRCYG